MIRRILSLALLCAAPLLCPAQTFEKDNGVIRIRMNDHAPIITSLWINGVLAVPHDNIGADFQMATRSSQGDAYNPTQGGDCSGQRSVLSGVIPDWNGAMTGVPASNGILLGIDPRNYNEPSYPGCLGPGALLPYDMAFGVTLGDNISMPKQIMVLDLSIRKESESTPDLVKSLSELPVMFVDNNRFRYAYYSDDGAPKDGLTFVPFQQAAGGVLTHDSKKWPYLDNYVREGVAVMLCDRADALQQPSLGVCIAIYSHERTRVYASNRQGAIYPLTLISALGDNPAAPVINDTHWHTHRRLVLVGNPSTVSAAAAWAEKHMNASHWARW